MNARRALIAAALSGLAFSAPAAAQERVQLRAGFLPDPFALDVTPGGEVEADADLGEDCAGWISDAPQVRLRYSAGRVSLHIFAGSRTDTVLVVRDPSGTITCNDDHAGLDPGVSIDAPASGTYDIWVGTFDEGGSGRATLLISEVSLDARPPDWDDAPDEEGPSYDE